jgi:hypothetical protein
MSPEQVENIIRWVLGGGLTALIGGSYAWPWLRKKLPSVAIQPATETVPDGVDTYVSAIVAAADSATDEQVLSYLRSGLRPSQVATMRAGARAAK